VLSATELAIALLFVTALLLTSILDSAFGSISKISLRRLLDDPRIKAAPILASLLESRTEVLMALHLLIQSMLVAGALFLFGAFDRRQVPYVAGLPGTIVLMIVLIVVFRNLIPRIVAARSPEMVLIYLFPAFRLIWIVMRPFTRPMTLVLNYFQSWSEDSHPDKEEETTEEEIQAFISAGQEEGILQHDEGAMIESIVHFGEKIVREVMTPRTQIVAIDINSSVEKLLQLVTATSHARIPVYRDDLDNIEGFIHERDLLRLWQRGESGASATRPLAKLVRPIHVVPETKPVDDLLKEMKQRGDQIILVSDEYGGIAGLATMEDLIEEIVGEIHDTESGAERVVQEEPGVYIVPGSLELSVLDQVLSSPFVVDTECTTVSGAVVELFGRLPASGEKLEHHGVAVEVLDADRRRVHRLRMRVPVIPNA
jgi:CBS domain containing-hemolysin-like protein